MAVKNILWKVRHFCACIFDYFSVCLLWFKSPFWECVGVWKSVRGLSLQDGALFSVLLLLHRLSCVLVKPPPELGMSLNICIYKTDTLSLIEPNMHTTFLLPSNNLGTHAYCNCNNGNASYHIQGSDYNIVRNTTTTCNMTQFKVMLTSIFLYTSLPSSCLLAFRPSLKIEMSHMWATELQLLQLRLILYAST